jgi:LacI family transcriptional regulator
VAAVSPDQAYLAPWQQRTPVVFVDRAPRGLSGIYVIEDDLAGARDGRPAPRPPRAPAGRLLRRLDPRWTTTHRRLRGYRAAVRKTGSLTAPISSACPSSPPASPRRHWIKRLAEPDPPTAVFSSNIPCTMALVLALHLAGRTDVAVVGFGDIPMAEALAPAVTVLDQDPAGSGASPWNGSSSASKTRTHRCDARPCSRSG